MCVSIFFCNFAHKIALLMRVLLINGSPRKGGNTFVALSEIAKTLQSEGIESEIVWIGNRPMRGCAACYQCRTGVPYSDGHKGCIFNDDNCNAISAKFADADAFVFGSPVYYGQPNGALLSFMQRAFLSNGDALRNKPAAAVAICRRGGATAALQSLLMPMQIMNMPIGTSQYWSIPYGRDEGEVVQDKEGMQTMRTLAHNIARVLRGLQNEPVPQREAVTQTNFIR